MGFMSGPIPLHAKVAAKGNYLLQMKPPKGGYVLSPFRVKKRKKTFFFWRCSPKKGLKKTKRGKEISLSQGYNQGI